MLIFNMDYIIYEFTYGLNLYVIPWKENPYVISYVVLIFSIDYIAYEFTYRLIKSVCNILDANLYIKICM